MGCTTALDTRARGMARALAALLAKDNVAVHTLGKREPCCGDIASQVGERGLAEEQAEKCAGLFATHAVGDVIASSPHCFHTLSRSHPDAGPGGADPARGDRDGDGL